jgi:CRISPR-associated exonuclease Cas4
MKIMLIVIAAILLVLSAVFFIAGWLNRKRSGLPGSKVVYADTGLWQRVEKPLYDATANLTGKPDYIVDLKGTLVPVEVKSGWAPTTPRRAHILQLAAYCLLIERSMGKRPPYGLIHYKNSTFEVGYSAGLEKNLLDELAEMRRCERTNPGRSHEEASRCRSCGYRDLCDQKL